MTAGNYSGCGGCGGYSEIGRGGDDDSGSIHRKEAHISN